MRASEVNRSTILTTMNPKGREKKGVERVEEEEEEKARSFSKTLEG